MCINMSEEKPEDDEDIKKGMAMWVKHGICEVDTTDISRYTVDIGNDKQLSIANPETNYEMFANQIRDLYNKTKRRKRVGIYAGSFNPIHEGHASIIFSALNVFDYVEVVIADNPKKTYTVPASVRMEICQQALKIETTLATDQRLFINYTQLPVAKFAKEYSDKYNAKVSLIRGLRSADDFESEKSMAYFNNQLNKVFNNKLFYDELETAFFISKPGHSHLSSTAIRQIAKLTTQDEFNRTIGYFEDWNKLVWETYHNA